jgi:hypothetical protein
VDKGIAEQAAHGQAHQKKQHSAEPRLIYQRKNTPINEIKLTIITLLKVYTHAFTIIYPACLSFSLIYAARQARPLGSQFTGILPQDTGYSFRLHGKLLMENYFHLYIIICYRQCQ